MSAEPPGEMRPATRRTEPLPARAPEAATLAGQGSVPGPAPDPDLPQVVAGALAGLEKQISRAGREQFKTTSLLEGQITQLGAALDLLRAQDEHRATELAVLRESQGAAQAAARLDVIRAILPALDGLDEALRAGHLVLDRPPPASLPPPTFWDRLLGHGPSASPTDESLRPAMAAWVKGLDFVRERLLTVLAAEGVRPMNVLHCPFDSACHVALDVVPATPTLAPGTIAAELRRGYLVGDRVLRYAEVTVAK